MYRALHIPSFLNIRRPHHDTHHTRVMPSIGVDLIWDTFAQAARRSSRHGRACTLQWRRTALPLACYTPVVPAACRVTCCCKKALSGFFHPRLVALYKACQVCAFRHHAAFALPFSFLCVSLSIFDALTLIYSQTAALALC
jgi:hypothetical protein